MYYGLGENQAEKELEVYKAVLLPPGLTLTEKVLSAHTVLEKMSITFK